MKPIGVFKHKDEILFRIFDYGDCFFCELEPSVDWTQFTPVQKEAIGIIFKLPKRFKTIEELKAETKYYVNDWRFIWEG